MASKRYVRERVGFRFLKLSLAQATEVETKVPKAKVKDGTRGGKVATFLLSPDLDTTWVRDFLSKNEIPPEDYDVFVSVVVESDTWIVDMPQFAVDLVREIGGRVTFSFTSV